MKETDSQKKKSRPQEEAMRKIFSCSNNLGYIIHALNEWQKTMIQFNMEVRSLQAKDISNQLRPLTLDEINAMSKIAEEKLDKSLKILNIIEIREPK